MPYLNPPPLGTAAATLKCPGACSGPGSLFENVGEGAKMVWLELERFLV